MGNPIRRQILALLLERPRAVGEIAQELPISRPAVSKHLKLLQGAALTRHRVVGTTHVFEIDPDGFRSARRWLEAYWDDALARFKLVAENLGEAGP